MLRFWKNLIHLVSALLACIYYGFPGNKMTVIGVTGTDGKTTTSHLIYHILKTAGQKVSLVSTIEAIINGTSIDTGFHVTTPSPWEIQKFMKIAVKGGCKYFVLEVTSHALDQNRTVGTSIDIGLINNISHEHIDYHKTLKRYRNAKAKIVRGVKYSILNKDDANFEYLKTKANGKVITFSVTGKADFNSKILKLKPKILGKFNLANCIAASSVAALLKVDRSTIRSAVSSFRGIPGRMEEIKINKDFRVFIDFAHKPNALESALNATRILTKGKLIVVFGTAGLRDKLKRPMMGEIAAKLADWVILTAEDPRTEDVRDIINEISVGCKKENIIEVSKNNFSLRKITNEKKYFVKVPDRQEAINFAIRKVAQKGDLILLCGKGHEKSMCYGKTEFPWDEKLAVNKALYD